MIELQSDQWSNRDRNDDIINIIYILLKSKLIFQIKNHNIYFIIYITI